MTNEYIPGVCNIGPAEIRRRRDTGIVGGVGAVAVLATLLATDAPRPLRLLVALPAMGAASGLLQARMHFCAGFAMRGVFNFGTTGSTDTVEQAEFRAEDKKKAMQILGASTAIGFGVAGLALLLP